MIAPKNPYAPKVTNIKFFLIISILQVLSIGKSGFQICNRTRNPKNNFNAEISVFGFPFYHSIEKSEKGFEKTVLRNSGLPRACIISKKKTAVRENSFASPFSDFPIER